MDVTKTPSQQRRERLDGNVYEDYKEMIAVPEAKRTDVINTLSIKYEIAYSTVYAIINRMALREKGGEA